MNGWHWRNQQVEARFLKYPTKKKKRERKKFLQFLLVLPPEASLSRRMNIVLSFGCGFCALTSGLADRKPFHFVLFL